MSERPSILVVGVGSIGERHLRCFAATGRAEMSICEVNGELRKTIADRYQVKQVYDSIDQALAARPAGVVICTPANLHVAQATAAVRAGAHVLIEKPLSTSLFGVETLEQEIARSKAVVSVAYVYRAHPSLIAMRDAILSERFGKPVQVVAVLGQNFPFFRPAYRQIYYRDRATGGGAVQDALTHVINAVEWMVGPVDRLVADLDHLVLDGVEVEDTVHVLTRHADVMGSFTLNQHQAANESTISVICQHGIARFEYHETRWRWCAEPATPWHDEPSGPLERDTLFMRQAADFLDAMEGRRPPACTVDEAKQTLRVNLAILSSAENRIWQAI